jgi:hypothetical protein
MGFYAAQSEGFIPMLQDNLLVTFKSQAVQEMDRFTLEDYQQVVPKLQYETPTLCCVKSQRSPDLINTTMKS